MASTPLDSAVLAVMIESLHCIGNPASLHHFYGQKASDLIESARREVAEAIHANPRDIIWTSGATESINLAIKGAALFYQRKGNHIITLASEHKAVLNSCAFLETQGFQITYLNPDKNGLLNLASFQEALRPDTVLVSFAWVNNETGVIQNVAEIAKLTQQSGALLHVDAAQALGKIPINMREIPVDLLSLSGHKVYGPKGVGALYTKSTPRIRLAPQIHGGNQERGLRAGSLATHQIVGFGKACQLVGVKLAEENRRISALSELLLKNLKTIKGIELNGDLHQRVPHCINVSFPSIKSEVLMKLLPQLAMSSGSACHGEFHSPSHVLTSMGIDFDRALSAIRISLGRFSTEEEIVRAGEMIKEVLVNIDK